MGYKTTTSAIKLPKQTRSSKRKKTKPVQRTLSKHYAKFKTNALKDQTQTGFCKISNKTTKCDKNRSCTAAAVSPNGHIYEKFPYRFVPDSFSLFYFYVQPE